MKIKTLKPWFDKKANRVRSVGDTQEVTQARYKEIVNTLKAFKDVDWLEVVVEYPPIEELKVKEIKVLLDEKKVDYPAKANKEELYELLVK